ncbi:hypothetical protein SDC9_160434 [bioreactor metagenome]|uniref:Uncharacterized protein n=1 Tax=bioreactor metagenome TaxID=1076179 RepID=A0A645FL24_9ZZZZ
MKAIRYFHIAQDVELDLHHMKLLKDTKKLKITQ